MDGQANGDEAPEQVKSAIEANAFIFKYQERSFCCINLLSFYAQLSRLTVRKNFLPRFVHPQFIRVGQVINMVIRFSFLCLILACGVKFSSSNQVCGVPAKGDGLIHHGNNFPRGKWPWTVALMQQTNNGSVFICAGTLISKTKVLTAAHCIHEKNSARTKTRDISVLFGIHDLRAQTQNGVYSDSPQEIFVHPSWNPYTSNFDADIAAMIFEDEIPMTRLIRPICLSNRDLDFTEGWVTGWGKSEDATKIHENIPKELKTPIWENDYCFLQANQITALASMRTFCGGSRNGAGVCHGDSGGGLFVEFNGAYHLKGIVSSSLLKENKCDVSNFSIFTNVAKFLAWIHEPTEEISVQANDDVKNEECGIMSTSAGLIQHGTKSKDVQWPWSVIVFNKQFQARVEGKTYTDFEVGTLISDKFIIADGLYFSKEENGKRRGINADLIKVYFGVTNLDNYASEHSLVLDGAEEIFLHPHLGFNFSLKYANFALIKMQTVVTFSQYISPICLSSFKGDPFAFQGRYAYAVGMGYSETGKTKDKLHAALRIITKRACEKDWSVVKDNSSYFCAGGDSSSNACWADHPLYLKNGGKWYLHGFFQIAYNDGNGCRTDMPVLYELAGPYYDWIQNKITNN